MKTTLVIGTRGSDLALKQADITKQALEAARPQLTIDIKIITTEGDVNTAPIPLDVSGKGWFTKEIEKELAEGSIDLAVHSLKDLPESLPAGLYIGAYLEREDARDALVSKGNIALSDLPSGAVVGTDSVRRKIQILALRNDLVVTSVRGNVPTRLKKLETEHYDAVVLAAAGLKRLGLESRITRYFDIKEMMPSPGQGILAIEAREGDAEMAQLLADITHAQSAAEAEAERVFSKTVGGGCKTPIGAFASAKNGLLVLKGMLADDSGSRILRDSIEGPSGSAAGMAKELGARMLEALNR